jgi:hypothetical protein
MSDFDPLVPGIDMRQYVFGEPALAGPRVDPAQAPPVLPALPPASTESSWPMNMLKGLLPMGGDWLFGAAPAGETDLRHDPDPQVRERATQQAADAEYAKRTGQEAPQMSLFDGLF